MKKICDYCACDICSGNIHEDFIIFNCETNNGLICDICFFVLKKNADLKSEWKSVDFSAE